MLSDLEMLGKDNHIALDKKEEVMGEREGEDDAEKEQVEEVLRELGALISEMSNG